MVRQIRKQVKRYVYTKTFIILVIAFFVTLILCLFSPVLSIEQHYPSLILLGISFLLVPFVENVR